jgi:hypothetical protein
MADHPPAHAQAFGEMTRLQPRGRAAKYLSRGRVRALRGSELDFRLPEWALSPLVVFVYTLAIFLGGVSATLLLLR